MRPAIRESHGLIFECPSPSIWNLVGGPVMVAFDGLNWVVSMTDRQGYFREGRYLSRDAAVQTVARAFGRTGTDEQV